MSAAVVLLDALNSTAERIPEFRLGEGLDVVHRRLLELARDPAEAALGEAPTRRRDRTAGLGKRAIATITV
jgi:hypothetical protein